MTNADRDAWTEPCRQIGEVLLREWDPIGINGIPEAADEYDSYVLQVYTLLIKGGTVDQVFGFLRQLETEHIGLRGEPVRTRRVAQHLVALSETFPR